MEKQVKISSLFALLLVLSFTRISAQTWSFDTNLEQWQIANNNGTAEWANFENYTGVKLRMTEFGDLIEFIHTSPPQAHQKDSVLFKIQFLQDRRNLDRMELYAITKVSSVDDTIRTSTWYDFTDQNKTDYWLNIPENDSLLEIGMRIIGKTTIGSADIELDYISFSEDLGNPLPTVDPVSEIYLDSVGTDYIALSWPGANGTLLKHYLVKRFNSGHIFDTEWIDSTTSTHIIDSTVFSNTTYIYYVHSVDSEDRYTFNHNALYVTTSAFPTDTTWDFEDGLNGWLTKHGEVQLSDSASYSAFHSAEFSFSEQFDSVLFVTTAFKPEPSQKIFFSLKMPDSFDHINSIGSFFVINDGTDTLFAPINIDAYEPGQWVRTFTTVPDYTTFQEFGFLAITDGDANSVFNIDLISTDPNVTGKLTITPPSSIQLVSSSFTRLTYKWNPAEGNGPVLYTTTCLNRSYVWSTSCPVIDTYATSATIQNLPEGSALTLSLQAKDQFGRQTPAISVDVTLPEANNNILFDFEDGLEGWSGDEGSYEWVDYTSFSGTHSVKLSNKNEETSFSFVNSDSTFANGEILPGHRFRYKIWVSSEDAAKLSTFQFWAKDDQMRLSDTLYSITTINPDNWTTYTFTLPDSIETISSFGLTFAKREGYVDSEAIAYIDFIHTEYSPITLPRLSIPERIVNESSNHMIQLYWKPSSGADALSHYNIYRRVYLEKGEESANFSLVGTTKDTTYSEFIPGNGTFEFVITAVNYDKLESSPSEIIQVTVGLTGTEISSILPKEFKLFNNYPNPFNPSTVISYQLPADSQVKLSVYNLTGQLVQTLVDEVKNAGSYEVNFNASTLASGMYIYRLEAGTFVQVHRMMLIK